MKSVFRNSRKVQKRKSLKTMRVEYIHGKLNKKDKEAIMEEFKNGKIDILISTTVIEVELMFQMQA